MKTKQAVNVALEVVGKNGLDGVVCEATSLPEALRSLGLNKLTTPTLKRTCAELHRQGLIEITKGKKALKLQLSIKGAKRLQRSTIEKLSVPEPTSWDGLWRMVTYDVPRAQSPQRRLFAEQLRRLGFVMVRESVWFHKYPCFEVVLDLARYCNLQRHITLAEVSRLDNITLEKLQNLF